MGKVVFIPYDHWRGGFLNQIADGITNSYTVIRPPKEKLSVLVKIFERLGIFPNEVKRRKEKALFKVYEQIIRRNRVDIFLSMSGGGLSLRLLEFLKDNVSHMVSYVADDPFNPSPHRDQNFPLALLRYDYLLVADHSWLRNINCVTDAKSFYFSGGYNPDIWNTSAGEYKVGYESDILFTGASYGLNAEGLFRAVVIDSLKDYNIKVWGDSGWLDKSDIGFSMKGIFQGSRLEFKELFNALRSTKIYLNLPSPQISSDFQPRVFELGAAGVFQICPYSETLFNLFGDSVVMFRNINELKQLVPIYVSNTELRERKIRELQHKIIEGNYSWGGAVMSFLDAL